MCVIILHFYACKENQYFCCKFFFIALYNLILSISFLSKWFKYSFPIILYSCCILSLTDMSVVALQFTTLYILFLIKNFEIILAFCCYFTYRLQNNIKNQWKFVFLPYNLPAVLLFIYPPPFFLSLEKRSFVKIV